MKAFGLVETQRFNDAEKAARRGLELQRKDAWSTHALAHVLEIGGRPDEGLTFLSTTVQDWEVSTCHRQTQTHRPDDGLTFLSTTVRDWEVST